MIKLSIPENIKKIRREKGLTQKELGNLCGMADSAIRRYESGRANPKINTLIKIAEALNCEVSDIDESIIVVPLPKYELTPERLARFKKDAEAVKLIDKKLLANTSQQMTRKKFLNILNEC